MFIITSLVICCFASLSCSNAKHVSQGILGDCESECGRVFRLVSLLCIIIWYLVLNVAKCILIHVSPFRVMDVMVISYR